MRSFVMENEEFDENGEETFRSKIRREMVKKLADEWNELQENIEQKSWMSEEERYQEEEYERYMAFEYSSEIIENALQENPNLTNEEIESLHQKAINDYYKKINEEKEAVHMKMSIIEETLRALGARMMRPYEHWNEDERYMEYMENRY